ncbi:MAG: hypothetical protein IPM69_08570 [Ignavibacteria bacterium]|nr:hypothetical protein [Ignavibacteria bacterium]
MILSIGVSAAIIGVMMSSSGRQAIFRFVLSCTSMFLITQLIDFSSDTSSVIPRTFTNFTTIPISKDSTLVLMTDRKPHQFPYGDKAMEEYLTSIPDSVILGIRGNSSEWISVRARESRPSIRVFTYPKHLEREVLDAQREEKMLHEFDR